jgi:hypothetical protein
LTAGFGRGYADRILKGEKRGDLRVQALTKYGMPINLKTAKASGSKCRSPCWCSFSRTAVRDL